MKTYIPSLLLFLLFCTAAHAKSGGEIAAQIAPLLNERTVVVAHVDLSQIDLHDICEKATSQLEPFLVSLDLDEKSVQGIAREAKKLLLKGEKKVQKYLDTLIDKCGVTDVYWLFTDAPKTADSKSPGTMGFVAIPLANRTTVQREALVSFLAEDFSFFLDELDWKFELKFNSEIQEIDGFQILGTASPEQFREFHGEADTKAKAVLEDAFKQSPEAILQVGVLFNEHTTNFGESLQPNSEVERQWGELFVAMTKKNRYGVFTFDVSKMACTIILQANSESDAKGLEEDFQTAAGLLGELVKEGMEEDKDTAFLAPFIAEFMKGSFKTVVPKRDGSRFAVQYENEMIFSMIVNGLVGAAHFFR